MEIMLLNGPDKGKNYKLDKDSITIGRIAENDIQIKEKSISRNHLRITKRGECYYVQDLGSLNGTFLKGRHITPGEEIEVDTAIPIAIGKVIFSIGEECSVENFPIEVLKDASEEFSNTAMFTVYKDRPLTNIKNLEFIYKVSNILVQSFDINEILEKILDYIFELLKRIDRGVIILVDDETGKYQDPITRSIKEEKNTYSRSIVDQVMKEGEPIIVLDTFGQNELDLSNSMEMMHVRSVMCVPLASKSKIRGVIYVDSLNIPYGFRKEDLSLLIALAGPAAIAIENALLYSNMENLVKERTKSLEIAQNELLTSETRFKEMFNNMSSGVTVYKSINNGSDFTIMDLNRAHINLSNLKKKNVLEQSLLEIFPESKSTGLFDAVKEVWRTGKPVRKIINDYDNDKITSWREYYIFRLLSGEVVTIFDDLTEKKRGEEEQKALQKQLLASQKMESIGTFAGGTAHNFRNILQAISGNVEFIDMIYSKDKEVHNLVGNIYNSIERGVDLINSLLQFSKGGGDPKLVGLDLIEIIKQVYEIISRIFRENIEIQLDMEECVFVRGDYSLLSQALMNIITNARDAMPEGGILKISCKRIKNQAVVLISDTGYGMDQDTIEKIFDPFFSLKDVNMGTGLGLSTALGIIQQHDGEISVSSRLNKGSEFKIVLPASNVKPIGEKKEEIALKTGNGEKVLIIDDDETVLDSLTKTVTRLGYSAIPFNRPLEALKYYKQLAPDAILIDRGMPEMDGITCVKEIIKMDPDAKITIISGYDESIDDQIGPEIKNIIKSYLIKPCRIANLSEALHKTLM